MLLYSHPHLAVVGWSCNCDAAFSDWNIHTTCNFVHNNKSFYSPLLSSTLSHFTSPTDLTIQLHHISPRKLDTMSFIVVFENQFPTKRSRNGKRKLSSDLPGPIHDLQIPSVCLGSGNSWLTIWQPYFIAAWKLVHNSDSPLADRMKTLGIQDEVLATIVKSQKRACNSSTAMSILSGRLAFRNILTSDGDKSLHYFKDKKVTALLCMVHLDLLVDLYHNHCVLHCSTLSSSLMKRLSNMMDMLHSLAPRKHEDLQGTPWEQKTDQNSSVLADGR